MVVGLVDDVQGVGLRVRAAAAVAHAHGDAEALDIRGQRRPGQQPGAGVHRQRVGVAAGRGRRHRSQAIRQHVVVLIGRRHLVQVPLLPRRLRPRRRGDGRRMVAAVAHGQVVRLRGHAPLAVADAQVDRERTDVAGRRRPGQDPGAAVHAHRIGRRRRHAGQRVDERVVVRILGLDRILVGHVGRPGRHRRRRDHRRIVGRRHGYLVRLQINPAPPILHAQEHIGRANLVGCRLPDDDAAPRIDHHADGMHRQVPGQ